MHISGTSIGLFLTPFKDLGQISAQARESGIEVAIDIFKEHKAGLNDLNGFRHVLVSYHCPQRANSPGLAIMCLKGILGSLVIVEGINVLDQTPVLAIKPYIAESDMQDTGRFGWFEEKMFRQKP